MAMAWEIGSRRKGYQLRMERRAEGQPTEKQARKETRQKRGERGVENGGAIKGELPNKLS